MGSKFKALMEDTKTDWLPPPPPPPMGVGCQRESACRAWAFSSPEGPPGFFGGASGLGAAEPGVSFGAAGPCSGIGSGELWGMFGVGALSSLGATLGGCGVPASTFLASLRVSLRFLRGLRFSAPPAGAVSGTAGEAAEGAWALDASFPAAGFAPPLMFALLPTALLPFALLVLLLPFCICCCGCCCWFWFWKPWGGPRLQALFCPRGGAC
mmetsp:Transcript_52025/g.110606  ORF Transcript_52025/g.110606 Transcript_52025/m.110606 type:complete len:211 (-) Transcript_52025:182-814(-)